MNKKIISILLFLLIIIPIGLSLHLRSIPAEIPSAENWAHNSVKNNIISQIEGSVNNDFAYLTQDSKNQKTIQLYNQYVLDNSNQIKNEESKLTEMFKNKLKDPDGTTYLMAIDPWLFYGYANNYVKTNSWGNFQDPETGKIMYKYRNGRFGKVSDFQLLPYLIVQTQKVMNLFSETSVMKAAFYVPVIFATLGVIFAFMFGWLIKGWSGGLVSSSIVAVHGALMGRTVGGFTDTDVLIFLFQMLTVFSFGLMYHFRNIKQVKEHKIPFILSTLFAGFAMGLYAKSHASWWHLFDLFLGILFIMLSVVVIKNRAEFKISKKEIFKIYEVKNHLRMIFAYFVSSIIFSTLINTLLGGSSLLRSFWIITRTIITGPLNYINLKSVGVSSLWPNVFTTVAELNKGNLNSVYETMGGIPIVILALIGSFWLIFNGIKDSNKHDQTAYGLIIFFWLVSSIYAAQSSLRFSAFVVPAVALGIGALVGILIKDIFSKINFNNKILPNILLTILVLFIFTIFIFKPIYDSGHSVAENTIPSMDDAWYNSLIKIQQDSDDAIITSWWDFGHWFVSVAERRVTFDGGNQGERIYWVGRLLNTPDEKEAVGILRLLNCGQEKAPHEIEAQGFSTSSSIDILNTIIKKNKEDARKLLISYGLADPESILKYTHCDDLIPQYFITSDDMVNKANVWGHFGLWDFNKATMYQEVKPLQELKGIEVLKSKYSKNNTEAIDLYNDIQETKADMWISPWPGYGQIGDCKVNNTTAICDFITIDLNNSIAYMKDQFGNEIPAYSLVFPSEDGIKEIEYDGINTGASVLFIPIGNNEFKYVLSDHEQANSLFSWLYFYGGINSKCFKQISNEQGFRGDSIQVWKVDFGCLEE